MVICPGHLVEKWKSEIDRFSPLSESIIVDNFDHFKRLESKIKDPKRRRNLFMILSKETAKFGYEERPAVNWSRSKRTYVCPECGQGLTKKESVGTGRRKYMIDVPLDPMDFTKPYAFNGICTNKISKWDPISRRNEEITCGNKLWTPVIKDVTTDWIKLGADGWVEKKNLLTISDILTRKPEKLRKEQSLLNAVNVAIETIEDDGEDINIVRAPRKYPISKYIREYYKGKIDYLIADEIHLYKSGDSNQGAAFGDLVNSSKKVIALTGTLLNGYANGLFYILYRTYPHVMRKEGFDYGSEMAFARTFGVVRNVATFGRDSYGNMNSRVGHSKEKILPGVSPLVFTKFLLENSAFIALSDISEGLPGYKEIPMGIPMDPELAEAYAALEVSLRETTGWHGSGSGKTAGSLLQHLSVYPDQCYDQPAMIHPDTGEILVTPPSLSKRTRDKEERLMELVKAKVANGEKVLIYYSWTNRTNLGTRLPEMFKEEGINAITLNSSTVSSKNREEWIDKKVDEGIDVLICNPTLVETGLDLLAFTTIVFYQVGYNLFTMRQASRRSWRISQDKDIEVYFMYYENTIQEQALSLMATKLQASQAIEGKFSEEGLHAMSNNEDLLTQIANSVVSGIRSIVDIDVFGANTHKSVLSKEDAILSGILDSASPDAKVVTTKAKKEAIVYAPKGKFTSYTLFTKNPKKKTKKKSRTTISEKTNVMLARLFNNEEHVANL